MNNESEIHLDTPQEHRSEVNYPTKQVSSFSSIARQDSNQFGNNSKRNFSENFDKMKNESPQDENITVEDIKIGNIEFPQLP